MDFIDTMPVWALALLIFGLRIVDVSMGTVRTISVVMGMVRLSVIMGFMEVLIWVVAVSQVIAHIDQSPFLPLAYATGFATGNALGILIERRIALGVVVVRILSPDSGFEIADTLRSMGQVLTTFTGSGRNGPVTLIFITCNRKDLPDILQVAQQVDPKIFYTVEPAREWSGNLRSFHPATFHQATGWRSIIKKK